jgi:hypothetical protein
MMKTRKPKIGSLIQINLKQSQKAFARMLADAQLAVYSFHTNENEFSVEEVYCSKILWICGVMKSAFAKTEWEVIDLRPLEPELTCPVEYYIRDSLSGKYSIYRSSDGNIRPATYDECRLLESAAVWSAEHIESRLADHFSGNPSIWIEQLKPNAK